MKQLKARRVRVIAAIDLEPYTTLAVGEGGTAVATERDAEGLYSINVRMDKRHNGLARWDNVAHLVTPDTTALRFERRAETILRAMVPRCPASFVWAIILVLGAFWLGTNV